MFETAEKSNEYDTNALYQYECHRLVFEKCSACQTMQRLQTFVRLSMCVGSVICRRTSTERHEATTWVWLFAVEYTRSMFQTCSPMCIDCRLLLHDGVARNRLETAFSKRNGVLICAMCFVLDLGEEEPNITNP